MAKKSGNKSDAHILKRMLKYVRPYKGAFWGTTILTIVAAGLEPLRPWLIQYTIDEHVATANIDGLLYMTILMIVVLLLEGLVQFSRSYWADWLGQYVIKDIRVDIYKKLVTYKLKYYDKNPIGSLVTRVVSDIETISEVFSKGIITIIGDFLKIIVILIVMFSINWKLSLITLSTLPFLLIGAYMFKNAIKKAFNDVRTQVSNLNTFVQEHITGINIVQIFNREKEEFESFKSVNKKHADANIRSIWAYSVFFPVVEFLVACSLALLVWRGSLGVLDNTFTFGNLVAFILYINMLFRPIRQIADNINVLQMGVVSSRRVFRVMDENMVFDFKGDQIIEHCEGQVEFRNVNFAYEDENWVVQDLNLFVNPGETMAIVGATGAGKTSIINLLGRFYEYQKGDIYIDGTNIKDIKVSSLRNHISVVTQDIFLFSDTIYNNIVLGDTSISMEEVVEASKLVGLHDFIERLPGGYLYNVRERGGMLSVGQRQLISFIRAYVQKPSILILDEATSSIDNESERLIQNAIEKITKNRTSIVIAHRLTTIQKADQIVVMEKGKVIEQGNHQSLMQDQGHYKKLYDLQFKN